MRAPASASLTAEINVTPLVDVCLVLLIIFMVVTPMIVHGVPVSLPKAGTAEALARQPLHVTLTADATVFVGSRVLRLDEVRGALESERAVADRPLVVRADKSVAYGEVAKLLARCREAGFSDVGLAAEREPR